MTSTEYTSATNQLLVEIIAELRKANSAAREGAISSVEIRFTAATKDLPSKPAPVVKRYSGSEPEIEEAILDYARAVLLLEQAQMNGWAETVYQLNGGAK
jgi:hypothetical protein